MRKYKYTYNWSGRLLKAEFGQYSGSTFDLSAGIDYTSIMGNGVNFDSAYDYNGNIRRMKQYGWKLNSSPLIDDMSYTYTASSNKLAKVTDAIIDQNSKLGDFKDGASPSDDYDYDVNGNLTKDNNKRIRKRKNILHL